MPWKPKDSLGCCPQGLPASFIFIFHFVSLLFLFLESGPLTGLELPKEDKLANSTSPSLGWQTHAHAGLFHVGSVDGTLVLALAQQVLYGLSHLPSSKHLYLRMATAVLPMLFLLVAAVPGRH